MCHKKLVPLFSILKFLRLSPSLIPPPPIIGNPLMPSYARFPFATFDIANGGNT
jgi:hypothetical protein